MNRRILMRYICGVAISGTLAIGAFGQDSVKPPEKTSTAPPGGRHVYYVGPMGRGSMNAAGASENRPGSNAPGSVGATEVSTWDKGSNGNGGGLPLWTFRVHSSRDGHSYPGTMVGSNPFDDPESTSVPTVVIPIRIKTKTIGTSVDPLTGLITTQPGDTTFDPGAENACLTAPNNVPSALVRQSPMFTPASFSFGGTFVGTTEYNDAFQRANFWNVSSKERSKYHVLLKPAQFLQPIEMDPPDVFGLALTDGTVLEAILGTTTPFCAPLGIVDINWFDTMLTSTVIPELQEEGILNPGTFPVFMVSNVFWAAPANNLFTCCIGGYHGTTGFPIPTQTYSPADFDSTGVFGVGASDSSILSHEIDEWMNDPMISNPTPPWGNTGQVAGCQANLEVGDPLTGSLLPPITMPNGFTYHLQELAFFSWFFGTPSTAVNGWFSDNNTFKTDAGPPCH